MKTRTFGADWLIPLLGIVLVGGSYFSVKSYLGFAEQLDFEERFEATMDRLWEDCDLSRILVQAQASGCATTARSLDELLSANVATHSARLTSADPDTRGLVEAYTGFIDRRRSESTPMAGDARAGRSDRGVAGRRLLAQTLANASPGD
jgi:hypothetical protein